MALLDEDTSPSMFSEINVTPFVDVMLVLLVIFMVTAPLMVQNISVDLPEGSGVSQDYLQKEPLVVSIHKDGTLSVAEKTFTFDELSSFLRDNPRIKAKEDLYVEADEEIRHKLLVKVMSLVHDAGANKINIMMQKKP